MIYTKSTLIRRQKRLPLGVFCLVATLAMPVAGTAETVRVDNDSHPTRCAEEDNVYVKFEGRGIRRFSIEAIHPVYAASIASDNSAADFAGCTPWHDRLYRFAPKDVTLYEDADYALVGHTFANFWRPESVDVRVGSNVTPGLHLVQLIRKLGERRIEILVVYPSDGYWRAKPLPPAGVPDTAYGSSFLIGPVEEDGRPFVRIQRLAFDPARLEFRLELTSGEGRLRVVQATPIGTKLEVELPPSDGKSPFAALRSMFVSTDKADASEIVIGPRQPVVPILDFKSGEASEALFARSTPSRHNTSAPDLRFGDFER